MKYIRTKDGHIYEIEIKEFDGLRKGYFKNADDNFNLHNGLKEWQLDCKTGFWVDAPNGYTVCKKQADNIEELCDEFVVEHNGKMKVFDKKFKETLLDIWLEKSKVIYGAIWTDKGLIFVAKLNDKGEWELL